MSVAGTIYQIGIGMLMAATGALLSVSETINP